MVSEAATLPIGKLPPDLLARLLADAPTYDPRILVKPGIGFDCAVVEAGESLLVFKADPITFATDAIGWYAVQVNANDIATMGATPSWFLMTLLLPEGKTTPELVETIAGQLYDACRQHNIAVIGGHTEVTYNLDRPIIAGTMIGEVAREKLITPRGARPGDRLLLTKGVPIEATAILAREFSGRLSTSLSQAELEEAQNYLTDPGISILRDAQIAATAGQVTAMHDPTEGGLAAALWELAEASGHTLVVDPATVPVPPLARRVCDAFGLDPLATIASGALLMTASEQDALRIRRALENEGIACAVIGFVETGEPMVWQELVSGRQPLPWPERDEIARAYEA